MVQVVELLPSKDEGLISVLPVPHTHKKTLYLWTDTMEMSIGDVLNSLDCHMTEP
jgi:hypothetical protein